MNLCECGKAFPEECARDCIVSENQGLHTQLTQCQERLAKAEIFVKALANSPLGFIAVSTGLQAKARAFLSTSSQEETK